LLFNAGVIPRFGPHRINVKLARALAAAGSVSMRFDLSGQGDSRGSIADGDFRAQGVRDIRAAMDYLEQQHGLRRFALVGICSGAVNAYWASLADERVVGVLMVDGFWYRSRWTLVVRHWKRFRAASWGAAGAALWRRLARLLRLQEPGRTMPRADLFEGDAGAANPPRAEFAAAMRALTARGVAVFFLYTGSMIDFYSYAAQFRHVFGGEPFADLVRCDYRPDIDHTFASIDTQQRFVELVKDWSASLQRS
jgi:hypothetical protein